MDKLLYFLIIPLIIYGVVRLLDRRYGVNGNHVLLIAACVLFGISVFIPSPLIEGDDTEFFTHLLGGGVFTGMIWLYFSPMVRSRAWYEDLLQLFVLVCTFGVVNELFELIMHVLHLNPKSIADTSWDLLANTVGVVLFYVMYRAIKYLKTLFLQR